MERFASRKKRLQRLGDVHPPAVQQLQIAEKPERSKAVRHIGNGPVHAHLGEHIGTKGRQGRRTGEIEQMPFREVSPRPLGGHHEYVVRAAHLDPLVQNLEIAAQGNAFIADKHIRVRLGIQVQDALDARLVFGGILKPENRQQDLGMQCGTVVFRVLIPLGEKEPEQEKALAQDQKGTHLSHDFSEWSRASLPAPRRLHGTAFRPGDRGVLFLVTAFPCPRKARMRLNHTQEAQYNGYNLVRHQTMKNIPRHFSCAQLCRFFKKGGKTPQETAPSPSNGKNLTIRRCCVRFISLARSRCTQKTKFT